jgi:Ser/Thr protein kinase RdoA (MazF antagonist)
MPRTDHLEFSLDWLTRAFGMGRPRMAIHAGSGQKNALGVLRLETSQGVFAVKRFEQEPTRVALAIEFAAYEAGFPMPQPRQTSEGKPYVTYLHAGSPVWVRVYSWVDGSVYDWGIVDPKLSYRIGRLLAALHRLPVPGDVLQDDPRIPLGWSGWEQLAAQAAAKGVAWAQALRQKLPALVAWEDHVRTYTVSDEPVVPSQRDLHPPNIMQCVDGSQVVVDWDAAGPVNAREEVAKFALVWASAPDQPPSKEAVQAFIYGYREAGGHFISRGILDLTYRAHSLLWWLAYNVRRDVSENPGPDPDLTPELLAKVLEIDLETLQQTAMLFEQS